MSSWFLLVSDCPITDGLSSKDRATNVLEYPPKGTKSAQCVNFALNGNIDGLKALFVRGSASARDISSTRGYSILRVSPFLVVTCYRF